ncbi:MAG: winged helix-turn-helix domain-containing protein [Gemmatimonadota bacterium]
MRELTLAQARRIALGAQGFSRARPTGRVDVRHLRRTIRELGLLQIDYVNVVAPAHYMVPFSRLGPYDPDRLDDVVYRRREFTEQWAHEASIVPVRDWPLLRHRREAFRARPRSFASFLEEHPEYVERVLTVVRDRGPLAADALPGPARASKRLEHTWFGTVQRAVLETHFGRGALAVARRRADYARIYDLSERIVPEEHHGRRVEADEARRRLLRRAARGLGVATASDLADYYRMKVREARPRIRELVDAGELEEVRVEGWRESAYLDPEATLPRRIEAAALLSPFDPVVWRRPRAERLFGFEYRLEIFVPEKKRRWGTFVLPFLLGDRLVARVDVKAVRDEGRLHVKAAYLEAFGGAAGVRRSGTASGAAARNDADGVDGTCGRDPATVADALADELWTLAGWLGLDDVTVGRRGDFARALRPAVAR